VTFEEYARHIDWALTVGRRRTRQTARQAASTMRERRPHGIRVNAVAPQLLDTRRTETMTATASDPGDPYIRLRSGAAPDFSSSLRLQADGCHLCELALKQLGSAIAPGGSYAR
jgi:NAD(P)-dependent dehydrogenase (short-subunit alcohol dehydrogenase family)